MTKKTYTDTEGYLRFVGSDKYVHIWIAETKKYGFPINAPYVVHHIDGNKQNNTVENLCLLQSKDDHFAIHSYVRPFVSKVQQIKAIVN